MGILDLFKSRKSAITASFPEEVKEEVVTSDEKLEKAVVPVNIDKSLEGVVEKSKVVFDLESNKANVDNIYTKMGRLTDRELRGISQYDSIVSLIITTRCNQLMSFGRKSKNKYQRGFAFRELNPLQDDPTIPASEKDRESDYRSRMASVLSDWLMTCGTTKKSVVDYIFEDSDSTFKTCSFSDFLVAQCRNILTYGRYATQIIRNDGGVPVMWRPIPVETLYRVIDGRYLTMTGEDQDVDADAAEDLKEWNKLKEEHQPVAYVQRINGKNVSFFTESEIKIGYYQKQAFEGLNGYPLAPIELAYYSILMNYHSQMYLQNAFTKGLGAKGIINLKAEDGVALSQDDVENFRKQFSNYVARNDNSATIPVMSGPIEVKWIPLSATAKDLEYVNLFVRVLQIVASSFQISLHEIGFGSLGADNSSLGDQGMKQDQVIQGEERGLRLLVEELFNHTYEILEETFPDAKKMFILDGVGLGQNTKEADLNIYKEELQTSGTFAKIWSDSERTEAFPYGGHVPTSPIFHENVARYMKYSDFMYHFFHEKEAKQNPAFDFIIDPALNEAYQTLKNQMPDIQKQDAMLDLQAKEIQTKQLEAGPQEEEQAQAEEEQKQAEVEEKSADEDASNKEAEMQAKLKEHEMKLKMQQQNHEQRLQHEKEKHALKLKQEHSRNLRNAYHSALQRKRDALKGKI